MTNFSPCISNGTCSYSNVLQSNAIAQSFFPNPEANWSMMPQFIPTKSFSACWAICTSSSIVNGLSFNALRATAVTISMEAEEESAAPMGRSPR